MQKWAISENKLVLPNKYKRQENCERNICPQKRRYSSLAKTLNKFSVKNKPKT